MPNIIEWLKSLLIKNAADNTTPQAEIQTQTQTETPQMKFLIVGLGNIGPEYEGTRHNIGFTVIDALARQAGATFKTARYGDIAQIRVKNQILLLLKPSTYMNLSGEAVRYWSRQEHIEPEHILVVVDDIALPFGNIRLRPRGADGGHNGLKSIDQCLGTQAYPRLRFGIGNDFPRGAQVDYVLSHPTPEQLQILSERAKTATDAIRAFVLSGADFAMTRYNNK